MVLFMENPDYYSWEEWEDELRKISYFSGKHEGSLEVCDHGFLKWIIDL